MTKPNFKKLASKLTHDEMVEAWVIARDKATESIGELCIAILPLCKYVDDLNEIITHCENWIDEMQREYGE